jgi:hypothetical protein
MGQVFRYPDGGAKAPIAHPLDAGALEILNRITLNREPDGAARSAAPAIRAE